MRACSSWAISALTSVRSARPVVRCCAFILCIGVVACSRVQPDDLETRQGAVNPTSFAEKHSGPGAGPDSTNLAWIQALQNPTPPHTKTTVLGYVDNPAMRWPGDIVLDVQHWKEWYAVDGIFFDDSQRTNAQMTSSDVARNEGLQQLVANYFGTSTPVFNWGENVAGQEQYVYCARNVPGTTRPIFVTFEGTQIS
jgi:hypothetical protein